MALALVQCINVIPSQCFFKFIESRVRRYLTHITLKTKLVSNKTFTLRTETLISSITNVLPPYVFNSYSTRSGFANSTKEMMNLINAAIRKGTRAAL